MLLAGGLVSLASAATYATRAGATAAAIATLATYAAIATFVWTQRARLPAAPLSLATRMTLARATLTATIAGLGFAPALAHAHTAAFLTAAGLELFLDNLDGRVARRRGEASALGAQLDGETDAVFVLALSLLAFQNGRIEGAPGAFVLAIGAFRYLLLAAAALVPWLRGQVPSSLRAKIICNVAVGVLLFDAVPFTPVALRNPLAAIALALLAWSFSFDVRYLAARRNVR
jgi:phosphatidylglycerophosphate synthase